MSFPAIVEACDKQVSAEIKLTPCHTNRSSGIGDLCVRKLVYERTSWQQKKLHDIGLEYIFRLGNTFETPAIRLIEDAGFQLIRAQEPFQYESNREVLATGHIDGILVDEEGTEYIAELKTMHPAIWDRIETVQDFDRYFWTRKYPWQLTLYMFGLEIPRSIWILINKSSGRMKQLNYELDYDFAEEILKRCEEINSHIKNNTLPDFYKQDPDYCEKCQYFHICTPPLERESIELIVDEMLINDVEEMQGLEESSKKYETLKKELKDKLKDTPKAMIGRWKYDGSKRIWAQRWETEE
jgi:CRISPR/Cas system-associated exonuclease Cas4 (RecB family)